MSFFDGNVVFQAIFQRVIHYCNATIDVALEILVNLLDVLAHPMVVADGVSSGRYARWQLHWRKKGVRK